MSIVLLLSRGKPFVLMCFAIFGVSFDKNSFETILFNHLSLNIITITLSKHYHNFLAEFYLSREEGGSIPTFSLIFTGFQYLLQMTSYYVTISINS